MASEWTSVPSGPNSSAIPFRNVSAYTAAPTSRYLSVSVALFNSLLRAFLVYEDSHGQVSLLNGSLVLSDSPPPAHSMYIPQWIWNTSEALRVSNGPPQFYNSSYGLLYGAPFDTHGRNSDLGVIATAKTLNGSYNGSVIALDAIAAAPKNSNDPWFQGYGTGKKKRTDNQYQIELFDKDTVELSPEISPQSINRSDLLAVLVNPSPSLPATGVAATDVTTSEVYGFWVNGTNLTSLKPPVFNYLANMPNYSFPFSRLGGCSPPNTTSIFIYHQRNAWTFYEDQWDGSIGGWVSNSFEVATA